MEKIQEKPLIKLVDELVERQLQNWQLTRDNYAALDKMLTRKILLFDGDANPCSRVILQHNPTRVRSTAAKLSPEAIAARPCFLCTSNQPIEQETILWESNYKKKQYKVQINPYPIFKRHLTISLMEHKPQICYFYDMMELAHQLPEHVIMFNGEGCGASAPDHMHFQATLQCELPLCAELETRKDDGVYSCYGSYNELWMDNRSGRQLIYARAKIFDSSVIWDMFMALKQWRRNALCWYKDSTWHFVWFPRTLSRPKCYGDAEGQFLVSPAAVEYGGVWVLPRKEDFENLSSEIISEIYKELSCNDEQMKSIYYDYGRVD